MYTFKKLDQPDLTRIQEMEQKLNCCIVAFDQLPQPVELSSGQLDDLKSLENQMGAVLVAYKCR